MDSSARQQAYDRGHTIFSPDGRLYQVEYAREAVRRGSPSVGVRTDEGTVLVARRPIRSPLVEPDSVEKIHRIDDHVAVASAGHAADARRLVDLARNAGQRHRVTYGEPIPVDSLATAVADHVQERTQTGGSRPYGTALLVAGVDDAGPRLLEVDPSGTPYGWTATAVGDGASDLTGFLEERLAHADASEGDGAESGVGDRVAVERADRGVELALEALASTAEEPLAVDEVDCCLVDSTGVERFSRSALADALRSARGDAAS